MVVHVIPPAIRRLALAGFVLVASSSSAQTVASQTTRPPRTSFADLLRSVDLGEPVTVTDEAGERIRGDVLRTSNSSLEIMEDRRWPWSRRRVITYAEPDVVKVAHHDSPWQGTTLGLGAGIALAFAVPLYCPSGGECAWEGLFVAMWAPAILASVGTAIDDSIERTLFDSGRRSALAEAGQLFILARAGIGGADLGRGIEATRGAGGSVGYWVTPRRASKSRRGCFRRAPRTMGKSMASPRETRSVGRS